MISEYLDPEIVSFIESKSQQEVLRSMTENLVEKGYLKQQDTFYQAVMDREKIVSTGIGVGVAIPHAKLDDQKDFFIAIGIHKGEGIEWKSLDDAPVKIIFLIGGPSNAQKTYLKILSHLTTMLKPDGLREKLLSAKEAEEVVDILKKYDC